MEKVLISIEGTEVKLWDFNFLADGHSPFQDISVEIQIKTPETLRELLARLSEFSDYLKIFTKKEGGILRDI